MAIKIITDSTSDITADLARKLGITVVPLTVLFGHQSFLDRVDITTDEFYRRLSQEDVFPTTTQPPPGVFADIYTRLLKETDEILVIVISSKLSGTYQSATNAISMVKGKGRIEVIDSYSTAMGLGLLVITAAKMATEKGASLDKITHAIRERTRSSHIIMLFDTLKYLAKGGRIGKAQGLLGSILQVKPVLTMKDGEVSPLIRLRSMSAGSEYLYNFVKDFDNIEEMAVEHATTPHEADALVKRLTAIYPGKPIYRSTVSPVLGTYMGPNVLSISVLSSENNK
jgi:DegV family protein with EDD domain